jgi:signal transduction histidine kinase
VLLLFSGLGAMLIYTTSSTSAKHVLEVTQRLNRDIAIHAAQDMPLFQNGQVNKSALKELAHHVMFINPIVEVYLLDLDGNILSHALPYETVLIDSIDMQPLRDFMTRSHALPIFGDDPRNPGEKQVFSISPVMSEGKPAGYLYTVLGGRDYAGLRDSIVTNSNLRAGAQTIIGSLLVAIFIGALMFFLLTRRLQKLLKEVRDFRDNAILRGVSLNSDAGTAAANKNELLTTASSRQPTDEIDELGIAIHAMSERIDQQFQALEISDGMRRELIANVSHDLRTPLASMQGYLETLLLKDDELSKAKKTQYLEIAHKHSRRLNDLIKQLFELSKLESKAAEPKIEPFILMELVQNTMQNFELKARERNIELRAACADNNLVVVADIAMIHRVLENLIDNAIAHTPHDGKIMLNVSRDENHARIEVKDTGRGIASHDVPHIFDRFYKPEEDTSYSGERNGLGLAIVKRIIELHQSSVNVYSEVEQGTAFVFWLPQNVSVA